MLAVHRTTQFKKDFKREKAGKHADLEEVFVAVLGLLLQEKPLPAANRDHPLHGNWKGFRDCHLKPDLVLIYRRTESGLELARMGSHSELFG